MASPNSSWDDIATMTIEARSRKIADNVSENTALLMRLKDRGNARPYNGGRVILEEIAYQETGNYKRYSGYENLNIDPQQQFTAAEFDWKQAAVAVTVSGREMLQNSGRAAQIQLLGQRVKNAERTFMNNLSNDIYSDGTADSGKQVGGLQLLIGDAGTGTVGGINSSTYSFWQNQYYDFSDASITAGDTTIYDAMLELYLECSRNADHPDLIVADNTYYRYYVQSLRVDQRFTNPRLAEAGFQNVKFMGADVVFDGGLGGDAPASHMYFLNTDYIHYRPHSARNVVPMNPERYATNQDAMVKLIGWMGNMTVSNRSLQGVIVA